MDSIVMLRIQCLQEETQGDSIGNWAFPCCSADEVRKNRNQWTKRVVWSRRNTNQQFSSYGFEFPLRNKFDTNKKYDFDIWNSLSYTRWSKIIGNKQIEEEKKTNTETTKGSRATNVNILFFPCFDWALTFCAIYAWTDQSKYMERNEMNGFSTHLWALNHMEAKSCTLEIWMKKGNRKEKSDNELFNMTFTSQHFKQNIVTEIYPINWYTCNEVSHTELIEYMGLVANASKEKKTGACQFD